ncbi:hypothetical protein MHBO_000760 [Bonamia ostreae]|uniref:Uncharacterized protein n=1 Tax=Bonamia ostreae TaxID=126728 RepID=A0ABV2AH93_9EUKA
MQSVFLNIRSFVPELDILSHQSLMTKIVNEIWDFHCDVFRVQRVLEMECVFKELVGFDRKNLRFSEQNMAPGIKFYSKIREEVARLTFEERETEKSMEDKKFEKILNENEKKLDENGEKKFDKKCEKRSDENGKIDEKCEKRSDEKDEKGFSNKKSL